MVQPITSNRYKLPRGYSSYIAVPYFGGYYTPWNGYNNGANSPGAVILGAVTSISIASVPPNSSVMTFTDSIGREYSFQFLYPATLPGNNVVAVDLPNGGASTAAQVTTALLAALQSPQTDSDEIQVSWTVNGNEQDITTPDGISRETVSSTSLNLSSVLPGAVGPIRATLPVG
jgi:hypothetical protein